MGLGPRSYLEIVGPDPDQPPPDGPRWFGIDELTEPRLVGWAAASADVAGAAARAGREGLRLGGVDVGRRTRADGVELEWRFTDPTFVVADGLVPFLIDWGTSPHPALAAPRGATILDLRAEHPDPPFVERYLRVIGVEMQVSHGGGAGTRRAVSNAVRRGRAPIGRRVSARIGRRLIRASQANIFMDKEFWTTVDRYIVDHFLPADSALEQAQATSAKAALPDIAVSPNHGKLLYLLAKILGAKRILEIGTLGGYSTIWLARALAPGGSLITLEFDPKHADVARANIGQAGLGRVVQVRVGAALEVLPLLEAEGRGPFDLIFIDADKINTVPYFTWALKLSRPGSLIIVDNVVRDGAVADAASTDASVQGMQRFYEAVKAEPRVDATVIQTVGIKGYDGVAILRVNDGA